MDEMEESVNSTESLTVAEFSKAHDEFDDLFPSEHGVKETAEASPTEAPVEAKPAEQQQEEQKTEEPEHPGFKKRIDKLTARAKQAETERETARSELLAMKEAFDLLQEQHKAKLARLSEVDYVDPRDQQLEQLAFEKKLQERQVALEAKYQQEFAERQQAARVEAIKEKLLEQVEAASLQYPAVTKQEIALAIRQSPNVDPIVLAKQIHEQRASIYEKEFAAKYKSTLPQPVRPQGAQQPKRLVTNDDIIADLDVALGSDWNRRR